MQVRVREDPWRIKTEIEMEKQIKKEQERKFKSRLKNYLSTRSLIRHCFLLRLPLVLVAVILKPNFYLKKKIFNFNGGCQIRQIERSWDEMNNHLCHFFSHAEDNNVRRIAYGILACVLCQHLLYFVNAWIMRIMEERLMKEPCIKCPIHVFRCSIECQRKIRMQKWEIKITESFFVIR